MEVRSFYVVTYCGGLSSGSCGGECTGSCIFTLYKDSGTFDADHASNQIRASCIVHYTGADLVFVEKPFYIDIVFDGITDHLHKCVWRHQERGQTASGDGKSVSDAKGACGKIYLSAADHAVFLFGVQCFAWDELEGGRCRRGDWHSQRFDRGTLTAGKSVSGHAGSVCVDACDRGCKPYFRENSIVSYKERDAVIV